MRDATQRIAHYKVRIETGRQQPPGKVADAEVHFCQGPLAGLKLIGFGVWEARGGRGYNLTFPARQYSVNGERRTFALLRPSGDPLNQRADAQEGIRTLILDTFNLHRERRADVTLRSFDQDGAPILEPRPQPETPARATVAPTLTVSQDAQSILQSIAEDLAKGMIPTLPLLSDDDPGRAPTQAETTAAAPRVIGILETNPQEAIEQVAGLTFTRMGASDKALIRGGIFPAAHMAAAEAQIPDTSEARRALSLALMKLADAEPRPQAPAPRSVPGVRGKRTSRF